jgi:Rhs element Vgr protein
MADKSTLQAPGDAPTDRVSKKILIDGVALSNEINVLRFSVSRVFNKIASAKLTIDDGSVPERDFPQSNSDLFRPGKMIEIQVGYDENPTTIFKGMIIRHAVKIRNGSVLEIEAKDKAVKLTVNRKNKAFTGDDIKDSDVFEEIIGTTLEKEIEGTTVSHKQIVQYYATDWDFILTRAEANAMFVLTDDGKIIIKKPSMPVAPGLTFTYGGKNGIVEFEAEMDARRQSKTITSSSWNHHEQSVVEPVEGGFLFSENGNFSSDDLGKVLGADLALRHFGNIREPQLQKWADAHVLRSQMAKACGRLRVEGSPALKPGQKITLAGVGDRFNGDVLITGILHQFNGGFSTDIQFGWSEEWFYKKEDICEKPASGLIPGVNGLQIGVVQAITEDPEHDFRVQVKLPMISMQEDGIWARVAAVDAGNKRGFFFRPEVNDEVILGFINDDPRDAVVLGMLHSQGLEPPFAAAEGNPQKGIVSREGMKVVFDDQNKKTMITVPIGSRDSANVKTFTIDQHQIVLQDEFMNAIIMDTNGITIKSPKKVVIQGIEKIDLNPVPPIP